VARPAVAAAAALGLDSDLPSDDLRMYLLAAEDPLNHVTDVFLAGPITMHTITLVVAAIVFVLVMMYVAKAIATGPESQGNERYITQGRLPQMVEAIIVYLRDEMLTPVMGAEATRRYLPFLMTAFFFILFQNLFGLIPIIDILHLLGFHTTWFGGTATGNLMVTGALAFVAFFVIQIHGFKELGLKGWLLHCTGGLVPGPWYLFPVAMLVFVVELAGHFIKPAALAIRLFANMVAGHTLMAVLLGFGAMAAKGGMGTLGWGSISLVSIIAAIAITFLELFVAFLQAFIFMFLTAVFISLLSHHEEHEEHEAAHDREEAIEHAVHEGLVHAPAHAH
jgi:F-type H+-transporting ATPase subunit a